MKNAFLIKINVALTAVMFALAGSSCDETTNEFPDFPNNPNFPNGGIGGSGSDDTSVPEFDPTIYPYQGQKAQDASADVIGEDEDIYHELSDFSTKVTINYNGSEASVTSDSKKVLSYVQGAHVVIDMLTNSVKNVNIILSGKSDDGSLKIYGEKKFLLTLNGVELTSQSSPAINSQCKKRMFVEVCDGTLNSLTDAAKYSDDFYYPEGKTADDEDRKGAFFSEGNMIFSGTGVLEVAGKRKHGIATDGYFWMRPGVTIAVTEAAKNAVHVKGDDTDAIGVTINGGLLYTNTASDAGKGIKTDMMVCINGGTLQLNTSGISIYDADENDTSSPSCIKADGNVYVNGGELTLKSTGTGGKGISTDSDLYVAGGTTTITTTGGKYYYSSSMTSSPKGIKADGNIEITGGTINVSVTGVSDGSEGIESKADFFVNGGDIYVFAYDDAINAGTAFVMDDGKVFCHSQNNDGLDSNGKLTINGGYIVASGSGSPEESFDCDNSSNFTVNGGTLIGIAGSSTTPNISTSKQNSLLYGGLTAAKDAELAIVNADGSAILKYKLHRTLTGMTLFVSDPQMQKGTYTITADNTQIGTFTVSSVVTTVGATGGMGGGGGWPGGPR